jgi:hypothetical protein
VEAPARKTADYVSLARNLKRMMPHTREEGEPSPNERASSFSRKEEREIAEKECVFTFHSRRDTVDDKRGRERCSSKRRHRVNNIEEFHQ